MKIQLIKMKGTRENTNVVDLSKNGCFNGDRRLSPHL